MSEAQNNASDKAIHYALPNGARTRHASFLRAYRAMRRREERGSDRAAFYLRLPEGNFSGGRAKEWELRAESLAWLRDYLAEKAAEEPFTILDAGAGNCWMTRHLAEWGHSVTALDLNDDDYDGLGAGRHYLESLPISFRRVVADFAHLPFAAEAFDLVIYNGALHYAENVEAVIAEGRRVLKKGGEIVLIDTPVYRDAGSGEKMLAERSERGRAGYVTFGALEGIAEKLGFGLRFYFRRRTLFARLRVKLLELRLCRETARMPWVVLRKP